MKMRKIDLVEPATGEQIELIVGETDDIKALYKALCRRWRRYGTAAMPVCSGPAEFNMSRYCYGIYIDTANQFAVVNSDTVLSLLMENGVMAI